MPIDPKALTPEQNKRLFDELRQDRNFLKTRNLLLVVLVIGGACLFGVFWMVYFAKTMDLLDFITVIVVFVFFNANIINRLNNMKKAVLERWQKEEEQARLTQSFNQGQDAD